jgi:hypothetical protein
MIVVTLKHGRRKLNFLGEAISLRMRLCFFPPSALTSPTVGSKERSGAKNIFSIFDKTFLSNGFLIANKYALCTVLMYYYVRYYSTYFARNLTRTIRAQEIKFCRLVVHCTLSHSSHSSQLDSKSVFFRN